jgi:hypothetical protein
VGWIAAITGCSDDYDSPAYTEGYRRAEASGKADGGSGRTSPTKSDLDSWAQDALKRSRYATASASDREKYIHGYKNGYEIGFKDASKPAF